MKMILKSPAKDRNTTESTGSQRLSVQLTGISEHRSNTSIQTCRISSTEIISVFSNEILFYLSE